MYRIIYIYIYSYIYLSIYLSLSLSRSLSLSLSLSLYIYIYIYEREGGKVNKNEFLTSITLRYLFKKNVSNLQFVGIKFIYDTSFIIDS